jgi:hypothetical protein
MKSPERRKQRRRHSAKAVEYVLDSLKTDEILDGVIANINKKGLCPLTTNSLKKGQEIIIRNGNRVSSKKAIVRWSKKYLGLYYQSGLEFLS